jgi:hypothetical protein
MKNITLGRLSFFALPLIFASALGCGPDKDDDAEDAVEEAADDVGDGVEEVGDEIDDATD